MPFTPTDLYLASGTESLINSWIDPVYKFDSSSFYNWEQDNLPIYDLEERDNYLFEMHGYPTSSVPGMMLTVSDCGVNNTNIFATVSSVVNALPNPIRFPIIIEVAASGALGELKLNHLQFEGSAAGLEIINRGFAKGLCGSASPVSIITTVDSGASSILSFSSTDLSTTMTDSSALGASSTVWQAAPNGTVSWWDTYTRAFVITPEWSENTDSSPRTVTMSTNIKDSGDGFLGPAATDPDTFNVSEYLDFSASSGVNLVNPTNSNVVQRASIAAGSDARSTSLVYANSLSRVIVNNCGGKIYIRGFCVDGANQADLNAAGGVQHSDKGFSINNSEVLLENCTAARCTDAGLEVVDSDVTLNRGFVAFHNYELSTGEGAARHLDSKVTTNPTAGIRGINSNITLSATDSSALGLPIDAPFCSYRNMVGIELINSNLKTPVKYRKGTNVAGTPVSINRGSQTLVIQTFFNNLAGIKAVNSSISTSQRIASFQNERGMELENSQCEVSEITLDHNKEEGLLAKNSTFNYNKNGTATGYTAGPFYPVTNFMGNGQDVYLSESSNFIPTYVSAMDASYERLEFSGNWKTVKRTVGGVTRYTNVPSVVVDNGSYMDSVCTRSTTAASYNAQAAFKLFTPVKGLLFQVTNGSTLKLQSHQNDATYLFGPYSWAYQQYLAGLYAGQSSNIHIAGPTTMMQMGVNVLAEDNSQIEFGPHERNKIIDASGWHLSDPENHTMVQLHSTRANLVVKNNSTLTMKNLGDYHQFWDPKWYESQVPDYNPTNSFQTSSFHWKGSMQFFPNPFISYSSYNLISQATPIDNGVTFGRGFTPIANGHDISGASWGGICVKAVGGSNVEAMNVRFPEGEYSTSEAYYDASNDGLCSHLRIWNIADSSKLKASYLSVLEGYPADASNTYWGPSAVYSSGVIATAVALSGAPGSTPDTSTLSVLDSFGKGFENGGGLGYYGASAQENIGPFRIYVSPVAKAKFLGYPVNAGGSFFNADNGESMGFSFPATSIMAGAPYQLIAQGYNPSGDCSATPLDAGEGFSVSSIYKDFGFSGYITSLPSIYQTTNDASSFYYTSAMIANNTQDNIWLDKSAMNTFANAKNGMMGTSGRKKLFSYYDAVTSYPGEGWWQATNANGVGFGSASLFDLDRHL